MNITHVDEVKLVENKAGKDILKDMSFHAIHHFYRAMFDYDMSFWDGDRWAWLNTLFGYDIGAERAQLIINWYDNQGLDVFEVGADDKGTMENITSLELGLHLNYSAWPESTPDVIVYGQKEYLS